MAQLNNVNPGDLIKAADWNALVAAVQAMSGQAQPGGVVVPNLFGMTLSTATAIIRLPSSQLNLGGILNTNGDSVNPSSPDAQDLIVLGQSPSAGVSVTAASALNLMVSPVPGSPSMGPQQIVVSVSEVQPGKFDAGTNTISLNHGATLGAVVFQVIPPNNDSYTCANPLFDSTGWGASFASNQKFGPNMAGSSVRVAIKVQPVPAGPTSTTLHFSVSSDRQQQLFANVAPTIKVL